MLPEKDSSVFLLKYNRCSIPSIRGQLGTIFQYTRNLGILFAYTFGSYYDYIVSSMVFSGITILFFVTFVLIPSTPQYLLQKNEIEVRDSFSNS